MARKTNKTSHVLNLITGGNTVSGETEAPEAAAAPKARPVSPEPSSAATEQKVVVVDSSEDEKISSDIRRELLHELGETADGDVREDAAQKQQPNLPDSSAVLSGESQLKEPSEPQPDQPLVHAEPPSEPQQDRPMFHGESQPAPHSAALSEPLEVPHSAARPESQTASQPEEKPSYRMVNVMEEILSPESVRAEMEKYGVCLCSRCQADVMALLLTRLPAKYIVADRTAVSPLLSYYKNKFRVSLLTQTVKACMDVREHPRHERMEPYDL